MYKYENYEHKNAQKAAYWFERAAEQGDEKSISVLRRYCADSASQKVNGAAGKSQVSCYIAVCVYGAYDCSQVSILRRSRDKKLSQSAFGSCFKKSYYAVSPLPVRHFGWLELVRRRWIKPLDALVGYLRGKGLC